MKKALKRLAYLFIKGAAFLLLLALFRFKVEGRENLPKKGPFIVVSNHTSFLDVAIIQAAFLPIIRWIAKKGVTDKWYLRPINCIFDTIVVNGAVDKALGALKDGDALGVFPEGTRSGDGRLKAPENGVAILALRSGAVIVPVGIKGAFEAFAPGMRFPRPRPVTARIGRPFSFKKTEGDVIEEALLIDAKERVMDRIRELIT